MRGRWLTSIEQSNSLSSTGEYAYFDSLGHDTTTTTTTTTT
jgi:hypothetical protein